MQQDIQWTVQVKVKPGKYDLSIALAEEMSASTKDEPGTMQYQWFYSADHTTCHILEGYRDSDAALAHMHNFLSKYVERFLECYEPAGFNVYGSPSEELQKVIGPFGPVYMGLTAGFAR